MSHFESKANRTQDAPSDSISHWESEFDRRRLVQNAFLAALGMGAFVAPAAARGQKLLKPAMTTGTPASVLAGRDTIRFAVVGPPHDIDPDGSNVVYFPNEQLWAGLYDRLTEINIPVDLDKAKKLGRAKGFPPVPNLAKSWAVSKDGRIYRLQLRTGLKSNFGNELTAEDVVWTVRKSLAGNGIGGFFYNLAGLQNVRAIDRYTVEYKLKAPSPFLLQFLSLWWLAPLDSTEVKKHATAADPFGRKWLAKNAAGWGPYVPVSEVADVRRVTLNANPNYWGKKPAVKTVIQVAVEDANSRLQLLLRGDVDYADELSPLQLDAVEKGKNTYVNKFTSSVSSYLVANHTRPPFNDVQVRQAVAYAIPYDDILRTVYRGRAERWKTLIPPWFLGATDKFWKYETDLEKAKAVLSRLEGKPVKLSYRAGRGAGQQLAILLATALGKAGLDVTPQGLPGAVYDAQKYKGVLDFFIAEETPIIASSLYALQVFFPKNALLNMSRYYNPKIDKVIGNLSSVTAAGGSVKKQIQLIQEAQRILVQDLPLIPLAFTGNSAALRKGLDLTVIHNPGGLVLWRDMQYV